MSELVVGIIGTGQMGRGLVRLFTERGYQVCSIARGQDLSVLPKSVPLIIEAVNEDLGIKQDLFSKLEDVVSDSTIIASNTSAIPISTLCTGMRRPDRLIGLHFMNPPYRMRGVEVVPCSQTSSETHDRACRILKDMGMEVLHSKDEAGFTVNRILMAMINEAVLLVESGHDEPQNIDRGMKLCCNQPMGPLELADFIGLDTVSAILTTIYGHTDDQRYQPAKMLTDMVAEGRLGRKTGMGFYTYSKKSTDGGR